MTCNEEGCTVGWLDESPKAQPKQIGRNGKVIESGTNARDWKDLRPRRRTGPMLRIRRNGRFER